MIHTSDLESRPHAHRQAGQIVRAPGKLLFSGAYAVLEGFPAIVMAVDRYAFAWEAHSPPQALPAEVRAAFADGAPPRIDTSQLYAESGTKLGLGSSAAALVAALALRKNSLGEDLTSPTVRAELMVQARRVHAQVQGGGSGVDIAASIHGGVLVYTLTEDYAKVRPIQLPPNLVFRGYWSGNSARTSELLAPVHHLRTLTPRSWATCMSRLGAAAEQAVSALEQRDALAFVRAAQQHGRALADLGRAADAPLVPPAFSALAEIAERDGAAFFPSGAGGGDVGLYVARGSAGARRFDVHARAAGMHQLPLSLDRTGVTLLGTHED